jgi:hypothetical protein
MDDEQMKAKWRAVTDPKEALQIIVGNEMFLGYDPYYSDLRNTLMEMAERCGGDNED